MSRRKEASRLPTFGIERRIQICCPKCKADNQDDAQVCDSCGHVLVSSETEKRKSKFKSSISAVSAIFLAGMSLFLAILVRPTLAFLAALLGLLLLIVSIVQTLRGRKKLTAKRIVLGMFIILEMISLTYWRIDAAPIPNDYTISDLRSALPIGSKAHTLLNSLADKNDDLMDAPAIGLSLQDLNNLEEINKIFKEKNLQTMSKQLQAHADDIISIWENAEKGRAILAKLALSPEIADLMEPDWKCMFRIRWMTNFRRLFFLHRVYICLQSSQGNQETAINELIRLDSIGKKMSLNARSLVTKLICIAYFRINIETANFIINSPETRNEELLVLKQLMVPFSDEHISLRNPIIFEYLAFRNEMKKITQETRFRYSYFPPLKLNSTSRLYRNFCNKWISIAENRHQTEELRVWPILYPDIQVHMNLPPKLPWYYKTYNPAGSLFVYLMTPNMKNAVRIRTKLQVLSDLLQVVLNKRLGRDISLKARAYSDEYIIDIENRKIFSPGLDGKANTKDDIFLPINPEVLGWKN